MLLHPTRRTILGASAGLALPAVAKAQAGWRSRWPVLRYGVITTETGDALSSTYRGFDEYLARALGVQTEMFFAAEYAAVIEALRANRIQLAQLYAGSYAAAFDAIRGDIEPLVMNVASGAMGYHSYLVVRADSPYQRIEDLRGKRLAMADPNSTSGYIMPSFYLHQQGIVLDQFFGFTQFVGGHEPGLLAVRDGRFDAMFTWRFPNNSGGAIKRMEDRGMIARGTFREVWETPGMAPNDPWTVRKSAPADLKADLTKALVELPTGAPAAWHALYRGAMEALVPVTHATFADFVEMRRFNERQRRGR
ncbi:phosphate/phosphite/phosphonate ABC transporter substrate-binding protein [Falsiroseomonas sp.]|uniref:phosphate/phosphite/phosphonate ABC transporter substrate-binding protein n=1 Tax=Falsiroseomonas sp. TaxID=2870721 RepID=UPI0034A415AB